ncbi:hypothetical protein [Streptomyces alkaliterrae]|uniref:Uncharacterized protein n=1 Tax=Streptomyces alkaliterrae TaxID=2213162 RepID=A0A5P0YV88_9ACTN|nr:hypothetical protein [Streptomyces alkaliterrae]MBB1254015.1 hypothetical protein [Streptomyces alkaliterrae]MBB1259249.1 hypothetical protein [Streptomyces alkaliterrae]MQS04205.1 hypothetical protein [Streptomyces alkaliterrae]
MGSAAPAGLTTSAALATRVVKIADPRFGGLYTSTEWVAGVTEVAGSGVPTVTVSRRPEAATVDPPPGAGTRPPRPQPERLDVRLGDGRTVTLRRERVGWFRRRVQLRLEYHATEGAGHADNPYSAGNADRTVLLLRPTRRRRSVLLRRYRLLGLPLRRRVGTFAMPRGRAKARRARTAPYRIRWRGWARPTADEAALAHAMVAVFGVGSEGRIPWDEAADLAFEGAEVVAEGGGAVLRLVGALVRGVLSN